MTEGRLLKTVLPFGPAPHEAGTVPVSPLLSSVMLTMAGKDPPLPHVLGRGPRSRLASRCSSLSFAHAEEPPEDHLHVPQTQRLYRLVMLSASPCLRGWFQSTHSLRL